MISKIPKPADARALTGYLRMLHRYTSPLTLVIAAYLALTILRLPMPLLSGYIIDTINTDRDGEVVNQLCLVLLGAIVAFQVTNYLAGYLTFRIGYSMAIRYRLQLLRHVQELHLKTVLQRGSGYLVARITTDPAQANNLLFQILSVMQSAVTLVVGVAALILVDPGIAAITVGSAPLFVVSYLLFRRKIRSLDELSKEQIAVTQRDLKESIDGVAHTKLLLLQAREGRRFLENLRRTFQLAIGLFSRRSAVDSLASFFAALGPLIVVWYGGHRVMGGTLTLGGLIAASALLGFLYGPISNIVSQQASALQSLVSLKRVYEVLDTVREPGDVVQGMESGALTEHGRGV